MNGVQFLCRTRKFVHTTFSWPGIYEYPVSPGENSITEPKKVISDRNSSGRLLSDAK